MSNSLTTFHAAQSRVGWLGLMAGVAFCSALSGSVWAASATATLNCQGETGSILAGAWKLDAVADNSQAFLSNGLSVTHPGSTVDVTLTFDKNPERSCFEFDLLLNDKLAGHEVANLDFTPASDVVVSKGNFTQTYRLTLPKTLPVGEYELIAELGAYADTASTGTRRLIYSDTGASGSMYLTWDPRNSSSPTYATGSTLAYTGLSDAKLALGDGHTLTFQLDPYSPEVLKATMTALAGLTEEQRRNPTEVYRRILSYKANNEVLWGRWDGKAADGSVAYSKLTAYYDDDKKPWEWTSSTAIYKQKAKYGQCWVFSCTLSSMARSVGIPSRPVTNHDSIHETGGSYKASYRPTSSPTMMTAPSAVVFSSDGKGGTYFDTAKSADYVWNFHVWTEAYYKADSSGSGWNAYDSTCQESADGKTKCGGSSVSNVLKGGYDSAFVAGETNADVKVYLVH